MGEEEREREGKKSEVERERDGEGGTGTVREAEDRQGKGQASERELQPDNTQKESERASERERERPMARSSSFLRPAEAFLFPLVIRPSFTMATHRDLLAMPLSGKPASRGSRNNILARGQPLLFSVAIWFFFFLFFSIRLLMAQKHSSQAAFLTFLRFAI